MAAGDPKIGLWRSCFGRASRGMAEPSDGVGAAKGIDAQAARQCGLKGIGLAAFGVQLILRVGVKV